MWPPTPRGARGSRQGAASALPASPLENKAISVRILEGQAAAVPIGIEGRNRPEAGCRHAIDGGLPCRRIGQVEDQKTVGGRRPAGAMAARPGELEMPGRLRVAQHDAVEAVMVLEAVQYGEPQAVAIERQQGVDVVGRSGDAQ